MVHSVNHAMLVHHGAPRVVEQKKQCCIIDDRVKFACNKSFVLHDLFFHGISFRFSGARFELGHLHEHSFSEVLFGVDTMESWYIDIGLDYNNNNICSINPHFLSRNVLFHPLHYSKTSSNGS